MSGLEIKSLDSPEGKPVRWPSTWARPGAVSEHWAGAEGRGFEPGWRWSERVKPIAGTDSCQKAHLGYVLSGLMKVVMDDGTEGEVGTGDVFSIAPGHDAWTVGDEACVMIDFGGIEHYAKR